MLASAGNDRQIIFWDAASGQQLDVLATHQAAIAAIRFSHDGKYVATGCNRSAQIFDVVTGTKVCVLQDDSVEAVGDLYIRSVCFSPDGKYLATGAEDKLIRVWIDNLSA